MVGQRDLMDVIKGPDKDNEAWKYEAPDPKIGTMLTNPVGRGNVRDNLFKEMGIGSDEELGAIGDLEKEDYNLLEDSTAFDLSKKYESEFRDKVKAMKNAKELSEDGMTQESQKMFQIYADKLGPYKDIFDRMSWGTLSKATKQAGDLYGN